MAGRPPSFPIDELHERVSRAATREFCDRGYDAATVDAIVAAAGVSKPVLYRAYGSKSQLYCTLLEQFASELAASALAALRDQPTSAPTRKQVSPPTRPRASAPLDQIRDIIDAWFRALGEHPQQWQLLNSVTSTDPAIQETVKRVVSMQLHNDTMLIRTFLPNLPEAEVEPIAEAIRGSLIAVGNWWLAHPAVERQVPVDAMTRMCAGLFAVTL